MNFLIVISPLIIILILRLFMMKNNKKPDKQMEDFWEKEHAARFARNIDISNLDLYSPDLSCLPFNDDAERDLLTLQEKVKQSANEPMHDFHEFSNTDLKLKYGQGNFALISKYDQNFMYFTRDIFQWGKYLYNNNQADNARIVLEYLISLTSEIGGAYVMLGNIYKERGELDNILSLVSFVDSMNSKIGRAHV